MMKSEEPLIRIVDDDEALCEAISFVLEGEGYETAVYPERGKLSRKG